MTPEKRIEIARQVVAEHWRVAWPEFADRVCLGAMDQCASMTVALSAIDAAIAATRMGERL